jgi:hypothetical protein
MENSQKSISILENLWTILENLWTIRRQLLIPKLTTRLATAELDSLPWSQDKRQNPRGWYWAEILQQEMYEFFVYFHEMRELLTKFHETHELLTKFHEICEFLAKCTDYQWNASQVPHFDDWLRKIYKKHKYNKEKLFLGLCTMGMMFFLNLSAKIIKTFNFALIMRFSQLIFIIKCDFFRIVIFVSQTDNRNTKELFFLWKNNQSTSL